MSKLEEELSDRFWERQSRQVLLKEVGVDGVLKIRCGKVLVLGLGGLGIPVVSYLASCGVGQLGLVDGDTVDTSNLGRQYFYTEKDVGRAKVEMTSKRVKGINEEVKVTEYCEYFDTDRLRGVIGEYDVVIDAVDRLKTKWMIHDVCFSEKKALVHAGVLGWQGQVFTMLPKSERIKTGIKKNGGDNGVVSLNSFFPNPDLEEEFTCSEVGVLSPLCGVVGSIQASEVIKYLCGLPLNYSREMLQIDLLRGLFRTIPPLKTTHMD